LGLDLHEPPRLGATRFRPGQVFTVEPGLYYPEIGGVRHEDVVVVTDQGCRCLSRLEKPLEI
ncbi:MAG: M24 family metallopeptidase, partial [Verrucomicrobiia bacterium]